MASNELRSKTEHTISDIDGDEYIYIQVSASPYTVKKLKVSTLKDFTLTSAAPIGTRIMFDGASAPDDYLLCDGSAISRTTYSDLYDVIGTTFGSGDGSTTFNVPDLQGVSPKGVGNATISGRTKTGPSALGAVQEDQFQGWQAGVTDDDAGMRSAYARAATRDYQNSAAPVANTTQLIMQTTGQGSAKMLKAMSDGTNGTPRTGTHTRDCTIGTNFYIKYQ